ncbi:DUF6789 family protein [Formosa sp. L2A11]|uniref:DUF6789 family protein n=1 Tax=Formosa sp. L2A11 TaxID=2686363 RepID=UPI00131BEF4A|nr:DUF6789 family protein [Formosa sp. L2A11]
MNNKIPKYIAASILGTVAMTIIMAVAPNIGLPKMVPWELLAKAMDVSLVIGWIMHFVIGILFGLGYVFVFAPKVHIQNIWLKGIVFGVLVLISTQIGMASLNGFINIRLTAFLIPYIVFGMVTAKVIGKNKSLYVF